jgi:IS30 family transposase
MSTGGRDCVATLAERKTGLVLVGKLSDRTAGVMSRRLTRLIRGAGHVETVTADNGTSSHYYQRLGRLTGAAFYFARPYHSRERGSNENADGCCASTCRRARAWRG